jgi:hypothetical protein
MHLSFGRAFCLAFILLASSQARATMPTLSDKPEPATLSACQIWAQKQGEDVFDMWGVEEKGGSSRDLAVSRLISYCLGDQPPEIVGFGSSVGFDDDYCKRHPKAALCRSREKPPTICRVEDPTPTPLNYRTAPYGTILGHFENGVRVKVIDRTRDHRGKAWVYVADEERNPLGWVFEQYIACE